MAQGEFEHWHRHQLRCLPGTRHGVHRTWRRRLRWFLSQANGAGLQLPGPHQPDDAGQFAAQYADASHAVLERIRSRGYMQVVIRPAHYVPDRVSPATRLLPLLQQATIDPGFPGDEPIHVTLALHGLRGRQLTLLGATGRSPLFRHVTQTDDYSYTRVVSREEVSANSAGIALEETTRLFASFGWEPAAGLLADIQTELMRG